MNKEQVIQKAWEDLNISPIPKYCEVTGYAFGYFVNGIDDIVSNYGDIIEFIDYDIDSYGTGKFRPKSLEGIEDNNGWIKVPDNNKINCQADCYAYSRQGYIYLIEENEDLFEKGFITHYQPIVKPKKPLYTN